MLDNEYKCDACGGVFEEGWSDEEAAAEANENFAPEELSDAGRVCDDCYNLIMGRIANLN